MGCDIHMWAEYRESESAPWQIVSDVPCTRCYRQGHSKPDRDCWACHGTGTDRLHWEDEDGNVLEDSSGPLKAHLTGGKCYTGRDYSLFAMLAGVRKYDGPDPYIPERGIPQDASPEYASLAEDPDGHSHSWLDMDDIVAVLLNELDPNLERGARFVTMTVNRVIKPLADKHGNKNVRVVFFFDN